MHSETTKVEFVISKLQKLLKTQITKDDMRQRINSQQKKPAAMNSDL